jgi:hypothetical protein
MNIECVKVPAFSAISLNLPPHQKDETAAIVERSRAQYAISRGSVERFVGERYLLNDTVEAKKRPAIDRPAKPAPEKPKLAVSDRLAQIVLPPKPLQEALPAETSEESAPKPAKRKRKRTRRKKKDKPTSDMHDIAGDGVIRLQ